MSFNKDIVKWVKVAEEAGWTIEQGTRHLLLVPPATARTTGARKIALKRSSFNSGNRATQNLRAQLRRAGLDIR